MVRPNKHALAHAVDSWHLCQKQYQFFLRLYVFLFFFFSFFSFFFFSTLHHYAYSDREAGTMGPAFIESYIIDNRENDSQIRYIGDDSSISFSPRSNVTTILSLSLSAVPERELCRVARMRFELFPSAYRFSICRETLHSSLYLLTVVVVVVFSSVSLFDSLLPSVEHDDDDEEGGWPRFQRNTNLSNYYVEKDHPVCSRLLCARQRFPPLLSRP